MNGRLVRCAERMSLLVFLVLALVLVHETSAGATGLGTASLGWSSEVPPESTGGSAIRADAVACPSTTQCTAVDTQGQEDTFNPQAPEAPEPATIDWGRDLAGISCPSTTQCTAVDNHGSEFTFNPESPGAFSSWRADDVSLSAVDCVSVTDCIGVGNPLTTAVGFDPLGPAESVPLPLEEYDGLGTLSCPAASQCTATSLGNEITFDPLDVSHPASRSEEVPESGGGINGLDCPSTSQCTAVETEGNAVTFDPASPLVRKFVPIGLWTWGVACPSSGQCTAVGEHEAVTFDPLEPGKSFIASDSGGGFDSAIACPSETQCTTVADDEETTFDPQKQSWPPPAPPDGSGCVQATSCSSAAGNPETPGSVGANLTAPTSAAEGSGGTGQPVSSAGATVIDGDRELTNALPSRSYMRVGPSSRLRTSGREVEVSLRCVGQAACHIELALLSRHRTGTGARTSKQGHTLAHAQRTIPAGRIRTVSIVLTRSALGLLRARHGRLPAELRIRGTGGTARIQLNRSVTLVAA